MHFLGGAFAGASPQLIYPLLMQLLARAGYTVISTPYAVTFKHLAAASSVHQVRRIKSVKLQSLLCLLSRALPMPTSLPCNEDGAWSSN